MTELNADDFARGINDAIRALRSIYRGVRTMLDELSAELEVGVNPLYRLPVSVQSSTKKTNPDEKFLRTWIGRLYVTDRPNYLVDSEGTDDDDGSDDEAVSNKTLTLENGQDLAFAKIVLYQHRDDDKDLQHPHLIYGILRNCRVGIPVKTLTVGKTYFRRILDEVNRDTKPADVLKTKAKSLASSGFSKKSGVNNLIFTLSEPPVYTALFDLRGRQQIREIATSMKRLSRQPKTKTAQSTRRTL
jgi:hypothetical protein